MGIHPTAIVDPKAEIHDTAEIHPFAIIGPHVRIGARTVVGPHCVIDGRTVIGEDNRFFSGAQVGVVSQDMKHAPDMYGRCELGNGNIVREHVTISAATMSGPDDAERVTAIGNQCLFMAYSHVAHDCTVGDRVWMANCVSLAGHVTVEENAIIGGLVGVHQDVTVGAFSFLGGMSRVAQDSPPFMIIEGNPARCCGPNTVGLKRNGFDEAARKRIKQLHRIMNRSGLNTSQALDTIEQTVEASPERERFVNFYRQSKRGVTR